MKRLTAALFASVVIAAMAVVGGASAASAVGTLDQQQTTAEGVLYITEQSLAQTFTSGLSGLLDRVDLRIYRIDAAVPLTVEIRNLDSAGGPGTTVLSSVTVPADSVPTEARFVSFDFTVPALVVAGTRYAIVTHIAGATGQYGWQEASGDPYPNGAPYTTFSSPPSPNGWEGPYTDDYAFKTYVTAVPTPSPSPAPTSTCNRQPATIVGTPGSDTLTGTDGPDVIAGLGGADKIKGLGGNDVICGGSGSDKLSGGAGRDLLYGGTGKHDNCPGGTGNDKASPGCEASKSADSM